jgi:hypothetical protein
MTRMGNPDKDPTQGVTVGHRPNEDPTQGRGVGEMPFEDATRDLRSGTSRTKTRRAHARRCPQTLMQR